MEHNYIVKAIEKDAIVIEMEAGFNYLEGSEMLSDHESTCVGKEIQVPWSFQTLVLPLRLEVRGRFVFVARLALVISLIYIYDVGRHSSELIKQTEGKCLTAIYGSEVDVSAGK